jgi:hypothetical protein
VLNSIYSYVGNLTALSLTAWNDWEMGKSELGRTYKKEVTT